MADLCKTFLINFEIHSHETIYWVLHFKRISPAPEVRYQQNIAKIISKELDLHPFKLDHELAKPSSIVASHECSFFSPMKFEKMDLCPYRIALFRNKT